MTLVFYFVPHSYFSCHYFRRLYLPVIQKSCSPTRLFSRPYFPHVYPPSKPEVVLPHLVLSSLFLPRLSPVILEVVLSHLVYSLAPISPTFIPVILEVVLSLGSYFPSLIPSPSFLSSILICLGSNPVAFSLSFLPGSVVFGFFSRVPPSSFSLASSPPSSSFGFGVFRSNPRDSFPVSILWSVVLFLISLFWGGTSNVLPSCSYSPKTLPTLMLNSLSSFP